jgi:hypothetical protein
VRKSSRAKCFVVSWVRKPRDIVHTLLTPGSDGWSMDGEPGKLYASVYIAVTTHTKTFGTPIVGPYAKMI